jgi:hypothetical protein
MKPTLFHYISLRNKQGGLDVLKKAGYVTPPKNPKMMADMLADYFKKDGEKAAEAIASIHPDKEMILKTCAKPVEVLKQGADGELEQSKEYLSCDSCPHKCQDFCGADAAEAKPTKKGLSEKTINTLIISGAAVLALGLIASIVVSVFKPKSA